MRSWDTALGAHGLVPAQALLVPHDFVDRRQYLHARRTLTRLLELGACRSSTRTTPSPATRSATATTTASPRSSPTTSAAAVLVLLTDLDGLYTADPAHRRRRRARRPGAAPTTRCSRSGPSARGSERGSGGMASKLEAARIASWSGVRTVIANAARPGVLVGRGRRRGCRDVVRGPPPQARRAQAVDRLRRPRRRVGHASTTAPARALVERHTSLLPAGVVDVARPLRRGRHRRRRRHRRDRRCPRDGVRRGRRSCARWPAATPATSRRHGPRGHPPRRPRPAPRLTADRGFPGTRRVSRPEGAHENLRALRPAVARPVAGRCPPRRGAAAGAPSPSSARSSLSRLCASTFAVACSISSTLRLDRCLGELGRGLGLGVAGLDLLLDLGERRHVRAHALVELGHRRVHLLLHLRLVELADSSLDFSAIFCCSMRLFWLHRRLRLVGRLRRLEHHRLQALDVLLDLDQLVGDGLGGRRVLLRLRPRRRPSRRRRP